MIDRHEVVGGSAKRATPTAFDFCCSTSTSHAAQRYTPPGWPLSYCKTSASSLYSPLSPLLAKTPWAYRRRTTSSLHSPIMSDQSKKHTVAGSEDPDFPEIQVEQHDTLYLEEGDVELLSSDSMLFRVHQYQLKTWS